MSGKSSLKKFFKKIKFFLKKVLTNRIECVIIYERQGDAGVAQLVEQLICNQQVGGSNPSTSSRLKRGLFKRQPLHMGEFQSGQMGQTVNLLPSASVVRIHPLPPDYVPDFTVRHIFLSIHAGLRAFFRFKKGLVSHYCHPRF